MFAGKSLNFEATLPQRSLNALQGAGRIRTDQPAPVKQDSPYSVGGGIIAAASTVALIGLMASVIPVTWWRITANRESGLTVTLIGDVFASLLIMLAAAAVWNLRQLTEPPRPTPAPAAIQRIGSRAIEVSWLGVGPKRRWTWVQSTRPLRWLTGVVPHRQVSALRASGPMSTVLRGPAPIGAPMSEAPGDLERSRLCVSALSAQCPSGSTVESTIAVPKPAIQAEPPQRAAVAAEVPPTRQATTTETGIAYVVQRGDTWWSLAQAHLGDGHRWAELQERNSDRGLPATAAGLTGPDLPVGSVIQLPTSD